MYDTKIDFLSEKYNGFDIEIHHYEDYYGPNDWDMLGQFYHWHRRYNMAEDAVNIRRYEPDEIEKMLSDSIYIPVYMYDHSGITINTTGFSCSWDSGQVGFYVVSKDKVRKEYGVKRISKKLKEKVIEILTGEISTWDNYYTGEVYEFRVVDPNTEECIDACGGYYGDDGLKDAIAEAKAIIDHRISFKYKIDYKQPTLFENV